MNESFSEKMGTGLQKSVGIGEADKSQTAVVALSCSDTNIFKHVQDSGRSLVASGDI